jgi:2-methylisocitrate lyase-like PEP mutase family enzyme
MQGQGLPDSDVAVSRDRSLAHIAEMVATVDLPVHADFATGYGIQPHELADGLTRCVATGVAGLLSVEDATPVRGATCWQARIVMALLEPSSRFIPFHGYPPAHGRTPLRSSGPFSCAT